MNMFLDHFTSPESLVTEKVSLGMPYSSFERLFAQVRQEFTKDQFLDMHYFNNTVSKCVNSWKKRDMNAGNVLFKKIENKNFEEFPERIRHGAAEIYHAAVAYYEYVEKLYDQAYARLVKVMVHIMAQSEITPQYIENLYEQNLNMLRIHLKTKNEKAIKQKAIDLLQSILFDVNEGEWLDDRVTKYTGHDKNTWIFYIMDSFIFGLDNSYPDDAITKRGIHKEVFGQLANRSKTTGTMLPEITDVVRMVSYGVKKESDRFVYHINTHFESLKRCPALLKKLVLSLYLEHAEEQRIDLEQHENYPHFETIIREYGLQKQLKKIKVAA